MTLFTLINRVRYAAVVVGALAVVLVMAMSPAYADPVVTEHIVTVPTVWLVLVSALLVNLGTALFTKITARAWVKAGMALALTAASACVQDALAHDGLILTANWLDIFVTTFIAQAAIWVGVTKPSGLPKVTAPEGGLA